MQLETDIGYPLKKLNYEESSNYRYGSLDSPRKFGR